LADVTFLANALPEGVEVGVGLVAFEVVVFRKRLFAIQAELGVGVVTASRSTKPVFAFVNLVAPLPFAAIVVVAVHHKAIIVHPHALVIVIVKRSAGNGEQKQRNEHLAAETF
jgi:hypothetical protein